MINSTSISNSIDRAKKLRQDDQLEASQELLLELLKDHPENPLVLFEVGGAYDVLGEEEMAIPYYQEALEAGLDGDARHECLICLGNCLQVVGEDDEAVNVLHQAVDEFPDNNSGRVFLALAQFNNHQTNPAFVNLLSLLVDTSGDKNIQTYKDVLEYYIDELSEGGQD